MGFFSRTFGKRDDGEEATPSSTAQLSSDHAGSAPPQMSGASTASIPQLPEGAVPESLNTYMKPQESTRLYNPYQGLQSIDSRAQSRQFRIPTQAEFVFQEEAADQRRSYGENMAYYTGIGYLGGAVAGGSVGFVQGLAQKSQVAMTSRRLIINRLLNSTGQTGRLAGNTLGTLGLMFAISENGSWAALDALVPYSPSWWGTIMAGALAGGVYRSPRGPRAALITAGVGGAAATVLLAMRAVFPGL